MDKFSDWKYERPDEKEVIRELKELEKTFIGASNFEEAEAAFLKRQDITAHFETMRTLASIRFDMHTDDPFYQEEVKYFHRSVPHVQLAKKEFDEAFLRGRFVFDFHQKYGDQIFRLLDADSRTQGEAIVEEQIQEADLQEEYSRISAGCHAEFHGEDCNFYGLLRHMQSTDRSERKEAMETWASLYEKAAPALEDNYLALTKLRQKEAHKLGFDSYIQMAYLMRHRFSYDDKDIAEFRESIRKYVVPAAVKIHEEQRKRLGVDHLYYYDETMWFPEGSAKPVGTAREKLANAKKMYAELSPETHEFFDFMDEHELFDLETRKNKRMGGYTTRLVEEKAPFILANFNGTGADVEVLTHEAGHAFEGYLAMRSLPLIEYTHSTADINEIHSMSMEFFTDPWYDLFFEKGKGDNWRYEHLADSLANMTYLVSVDEFQHKVFALENPTKEDLYRIWKGIEETYMPWRDYDGNAFLEKGGFWMQKQHIFLYPFYYVDYALAMTCALQFYLRMRKDFNKAWQDYLLLCRMGGSLGYKELLKCASLDDPFDENTVKNVTAQVMEVLENM